MALLVLGIACTPPAAAWGRDGHRIVGAIAERDLSAAARAEVDRLLADEPDPTLAGVANWADEVRPDRPDTSPLHYIDFPDTTCRYVAERDCPDGRCVIGAIEAARVTLRSADAGDPARREALKFLVHFVGDLHQPLHAGPGDERGGNRIQLQWRGDGSNLHRLWDTLLVRDIAPDWLDHAVGLAGLAGRLDIDRTTAPADWARESCRIVASPGFVPATARIDESAYLARWQGTVDIRLVQAGVRLAALLNEALAR